MFRWLETFLQDLRYALRLFRRARGFALTAVSVIALGIGATTAAFTLLDHVLLRPLPFVEPERLVMLHQTDLADGGSRELVSPPNFLDWRTMSKSFDSMGAYLAAFLPVNLSGQGNPRRLDSTLANSDLFKVLGVRPAAGRLFTAEDDRVGAANVVLLSNNLAVALFGGAADAVGRSLSLDNQAYTVVGVMPPGFAFPRPEAALWRPLRLTMPGMLSNRSNHILFAVARLRAGVSMDEARAEMVVMAEQLQRAYPKDNAMAGIAVVDLRDTMSPQSRTLVLAVFGGGVLSDADRVHQPGQSAVCACHGPETGDGGAHRDWSRPRTAPPAIAHRKPGARDVGRRARHAAGRNSHAVAGASGAERASHRGNAGDRPARSRLRRCAHVVHQHRVRHRASAALVPHA